MKNLKKHSVCKNCTKRDSTCHIGCPDYAAEVILNIMLENEQKEANTLREDTYSLAAKRSRNYYKKYRLTKASDFVRRK